MSGTLNTNRFGQKAGQSMLRWHGNVKRLDDNYVDRTVLEMQLPGKRRPKRRYLDVGKEDMQRRREYEVFDRTLWRTVVGMAERRKPSFLHFSITSKQANQQFLI